MLSNIVQVDNIQVGTILTDVEQNTKNVVIAIVAGKCTLCKCDTTRLDISIVELDVILELQFEGKIVFEKVESVQIHIESLAGEVRASFENRKKFIEEVIQKFGPDYAFFVSRGNSDAFYNKIAVKYNINHVRCYYWLRVFFQSGLQFEALVDKRYFGNSKGKQFDYKIKTGRPSEFTGNKGIPLNGELREIFDEGIAVYKKARSKSISNVFTFILSKYFRRTYVIDGETQVAFLPEVELPTINQFYNHVRKNVSKEERDRIKTSIMEQRNNKRVSSGTATFDVLGPGYLLELDETEADCYLVASFDREKVISRAIVYIAVDVYSRMIVGVHVGFDNNSYIGFSNLMMSIIDDKKELCKRYNLEVNPGDSAECYSIDDIFPSEFCPANIRTDHGSEYISKAFEDFCNSFAINTSLPSVGMGSLKGTAESIFNELNAYVNNCCEKNGQVTKRHDSDHRKRAVLTIEEYTKMVLAFVLIHNQKCFPAFPLTKDMIDAGVPPIPVCIWKYGLANTVRPRPIMSKLKYLYALMKKGKARLTKSGICFKGLTYMDTSDKKLMIDMYRLERKRIPFEVRYDPRDMSHVYYSADDVIHCASFREADEASLSFKGMSEFEYDKYLQAKKEMIRKGKQNNIKLDIFLQEHNEAVIDDAKAVRKAEGISKVSSKNIAENRAIEKQNETKANKMANRDALRELIEKSDSSLITEDEAAKKLPQTQKKIEFNDQDESFWDDVAEEY